MMSRAMKYNPAFLDRSALVQSFVARHNELERVLQILEENSGASNQHVLFVGPRGIGKTTLVLRTVAAITERPSLENKWLAIPFGEESYRVSTPGELWLEALFHLADQTGESHLRNAYEQLLLEASEDRLKQNALAVLMEFSDQVQKRIVLVVENLNMLIGTQMTDDDAWVLRHTLMNEPRLMLIGTATTRFKQIESYDQALYDLFRVFELEPLDQAEVKELWTLATGHRATASQVRPVQILTGGNPRLIRILSEFAATTSFSSLMADLTHLVDDHTEYFKQYLDALPPHERRVFVTLADLWDPSTSRIVAQQARVDTNLASALLKRLVERGAVTVPFKRGRTQYYQVAERMYNIYHLMRRRGQAAARVHAVVRFMIHLYKDEQLVRTTQSLIEEARKLAADERREHLLAYEGIVLGTRHLRLRRQLVEATRAVVQEMPDAPMSVLRLFDAAVRETESVEEDFVDRIVDLEQSSNVRAMLAAAKQLMLHAGEEAKVSNLLHRAVRVAPSDIEAWELLGVFHTRGDRSEEALLAFTRATKLDPNSVHGWFGVGVSLGRMHRFEEALEAQNRVIELAPQHYSNYYNRGLTLASLERFEEALADLDVAIRLEPNDADVLYNRAAILSDLDRNSEALAEYDKAIALRGDDATMWNLRGVTLSQLGQTEEAIASFTKALELDPKEDGAWYNRGALMYRLGRHQEAVVDYERAISLDAKNAVTWYNYALALESLGRLEEALTSIETATTLEPADSDSWHVKSGILRTLNRSTEAFEAAERAIQNGRDNADAWHERALVLTELQRNEEALESIDTAISLNPSDGTFWFNAGVIYAKLKRYSDELYAYERAIEADPMDAAAWHNKGVTLGLLGRHEEELSAYNKALEISGNDLDTMFNKAVTLGQLGRFNEQIETFTRVLDLEPRNVPTLIERGLANRQMGEFEQASIDLKLALEYEPGNAYALGELVDITAHDLGRPAKALDIAQSSVGHIATNPGALNGLARIFLLLDEPQYLENAERWTRAAVEIDPATTEFHYTRAAVLSKQGKWEAALIEANRFLNDEALVRKQLEIIVDLLVDACAAGYLREVDSLISVSERGDLLEPLQVAIGLLENRDMKVAREIREVAEDVVKRISERSLALKERAGMNGGSAAGEHVKI